MIRTFRPVVVAFLVVGALIASVLVRPGEASAHPLGNFTVSAATRVDLYADVIRLHYAVDMAEIPAFQERSRIDLNGDGTIGVDEQEAYLATAGAALATNLFLAADGTRLQLNTVDSRVAFLPGEAGLETLRIDLVFETPAVAGTLAFEDRNYSDRLGWREVTVVAGADVPLLSSTVPETSPTGGLATYPEDTAAPPLRVTTAEFAFTPGVGATAPATVLAAPAASAPESTATGFTSLLDGRPLTLTVILLMLVVAMGFGAVHALEPGHGKTIVAAYFVGANGRAVHAALLGLIVAATHSVGVLVIGAITLYGTRYILPEELYPWLTLVSGVMVVGLGFALLASRMSGNHYLRHLATGHLIPHRHAHAHAHTQTATPGPVVAPTAPWHAPARWQAPSLHQHGGAAHAHVHGHAHPHAGARTAVAMAAPKHGATAEANARERAPWRSLIVLGLVDGLIPTPSTLVVLLSAISLGKFALGLGLIVAFSVGLAAVLSSISLVTIGLKSLLGRYTTRRPGDSRFGALAGRVATIAPTLAAFALIAAGSVVILRASAPTLLG